MFFMFIFLLFKKMDFGFGKKSEVCNVLNAKDFT